MYLLKHNSLKVLTFIHLSNNHIHHLKFMSSHHGEMEHEKCVHAAAKTNMFSSIKNISTIELIFMHGSSGQPGLVGNSHSYHKGHLSAPFMFG